MQDQTIDKPSGDILSRLEETGHSLAEVRKFLLLLQDKDISNFFSIIIENAELGKLEENYSIIKNIELMEEEIKKQSKKRSAKRTREQLPFPKKSPQDEVNRTTGKLVVRVSQDHVDLFNICASKFPTKRITMEEAVELMATNMGVPFDF